MIYDKEKLLLIAGPCSLEGENTCRPMAEFPVNLQKDYPSLNIFFKGSFDKANRTSMASPRGTGIDEGMKLLTVINKDYALRITTDIHLPDQAEILAEVIDVLQIPAILCRQTDLLAAAARTGKTVNIKKGQILSPNEIRFA